MATALYVIDKTVYSTAPDGRLVEVATCKTNHLASLLAAAEPMLLLLIELHNDYSGDQTKVMFNACLSSATIPRRIRGLLEPLGFIREAAPIDPPAVKGIFV